MQIFLIRSKRNFLHFTHNVHTYTDMVKIISTPAYYCFIFNFKLLEWKVNMIILFHLNIGNMLRPLKEKIKLRLPRNPGQSSKMKYKKKNISSATSSSQQISGKNSAKEIKLS